MGPRAATVTPATGRKCVRAGHVRPERRSPAKRRTAATSLVSVIRPRGPAPIRRRKTARRATTGTRARRATPARPGPAGAKRRSAQRPSNVKRAAPATRQAGRARTPSIRLVRATMATPAPPAMRAILPGSAWGRLSFATARACVTRVPAVVRTGHARIPSTPVVRAATATPAPPAMRAIRRGNAWGPP